MEYFIDVPATIDMCRLSWNALRFISLFLWLNIWRYNCFYNRQNNISCWTGYLARSLCSLVRYPVRFVHSWDILVDIQNKFYITAHPCTLFIIWTLLKPNIQLHMRIFLTRFNTDLLTFNLYIESLTPQR